jgi:hypothetical protein
MSKVSNRFVLKFNSNIGKVVQISIPRADMGKTTADAQASMNAIIANGAVVTAKNGVPTGIKGANIVTTSRTSIV